MSERIDSELALTALQQALDRRQPSSGLLHHSDQGMQYAATSYQQLLTEYAIIPSMSRKGDCCDNAVMESFPAIAGRELVVPLAGLSDENGSESQDL